MLATGQFDELVKAVLDRRPVLKEIIETCGKNSIFEYARKHLADAYNCPFPDRFHQFESVLGDEISRLFGSSAAKRATAQMEKFFSVSTADHHGPLTSPFFINPNLICAGVTAEDPSCKKDFIIVFPAANVSFNNSSYPRGLLYHTDIQGTLQEKRLSFVPARRRLSSLYGAEPYIAKDIEKIYKDIDREANPKSLKTIFAGLYDTPKMLAQKDFSDQMTLGNFALWKRFFPPRANVPELLYIPIENIARELFLRHHLGKRTLIDKMVFDEGLMPLVERFFNGATGAFDKEKKEGTYLFWGLLEGKNYLVALFRNGRYIEDITGTFRIELTREAIAEALQKKRIVPSLFFDYLLLVMWHGLRCFGGFNQVNYLTEMKQKYAAFCKEIAYTEDLAALEEIDTKALAGDLTVAYVKTKNRKKLYPATGLDLILYQHPDTWNVLREMLHKTSLADGIYPLIAEFYPIVCSQSERKPELSTITPDDIAEYLDLENKLTACVEIV